MKPFAHYAILALAVLLLPSRVDAQYNPEKQPDNFQGTDIQEHLGEFIPLDVRMATSDGDSVTIGELMEEGKPVLLNPLYYECPMLCGLVVDGVLDVVDDVIWQPGDEYIIISFSIDPKEDHKLAAKYKKKHLSTLNKKGIDNGWYYLTGTKSAIDSLTNAAGFGYREIEDTGEYAHTAAVMFLSPNGKITRYLYGITFNEFDVRSALFEAADGTIGNTITKVVMYCYQYDPESGSYVPVAINIMKIGGFATLLILGIFLGIFWFREKKKKPTPNIDLQ